MNEQDPVPRVPGTGEVTRLIPHLTCVCCNMVFWVWYQCTMQCSLLPHPLLLLSLQ